MIAADPPALVRVQEGPAPVQAALSQGPVLAYGATLRIVGFTCVSQRAGVRCTNGARHGFFLSRQSWRTF
jgi:hypothetical protein